MLNSNFKLF
jgi:hypothetical protein